MAEIREVQESPLVMGQDEKLTFTLTVTPWGSSPSSVSVKVFDVTDGGYTDVSSTVLNGSPAVDGDVITLPSVEDLVAGHVYRLEILFMSGGNTFECYAVVRGEL
jgi:hypothetical protein